LTLADSQKAAVGTALASKVLVVTGGAGVGKTTIVNAILRILSAKGVKLLLCAPTGRAAKRMGTSNNDDFSVGLIAGVRTGDFGS
jgi:exodeoxyribonuclease V alpha subunit